MGSADIDSMDTKYQQMGVDERAAHHDELRDDGFEWCPECGSPLIWELSPPSRVPKGRNRAPIVCGDCPPLTADQLLMTAPATR